MNVALEYYMSLNFKVEYVGNTEPYDLLATRDGEVRRVEVKGSSGAAAHVELTYGEVNNSRDYSPVDLYVLDGVQVERKADGGVEAYGGDARIWENWRADENALKVIRYRYKLPLGGAIA